MYVIFRNHCFFFSFIICLLFVIHSFFGCTKPKKFIAIENDCYKGDLINPCQYQSIWEYEKLSPNLRTSAEKELLKEMTQKEFENNIEFVELRVYEHCDELSKYSTRYIKHKMYFKRKFENKAISSYCFHLNINSEGVFRSFWNLPDIDRNPQNKNIISRSTMDSILQANNFENYTRITLDFDPLNHHYELLIAKKKNESKPMRGFNISNATINLHTGEFNSSEEWESKTATNLNLLPKFGYTEKTRLQKKLDKFFIDSILHEESSSSNRSENLIRLGMESLKKDQDRKKAMYLFNLAYVIDSTNTNIYWGFGSIYTALGRYGKAKEQYEIGLEIDSTNANLLNAYAYYLWGQYNSLKDMKEQVDRDGEGAKMRLNDAIAYLTKAHKYDPHNDRTILSLANFYLEKGDCNIALEYYDKSKSKTEEYFKQSVRKKLAKNCAS